MAIKTINVSMPEEAYDKIKAKAKEDDRSISSWLRIAAEEKLNKEADEARPGDPCRSGKTNGRSRQW